MTKKNNKEQSQKVKKRDYQTEKSEGENIHLGSSNAFEETENMQARDEEDITDEKLDDFIGEE